jgi:hypothetical protein
MRILILGSAGQLGSELCRVLGDHDLIPSARDEVDITQLARLIEFATHIRPDAIINAAAYTDVDGCENYRERAFLINAIARETRPSLRGGSEPVSFTSVPITSSMAGRKINTLSTTHHIP